MAEFHVSHVEHTVRHIERTGNAIVCVITLTNGQTTVVDDVDSDLGDVSWTEHRRENGRSYVTRTYRTGRKDGKTKTVAMHRLILERIVGRPLLRAEMTDHKDGDGLNNRRSNLRLADNSKNQQNSAKVPSNNRLGIKGVRVMDGRYKVKRFRAQIAVNKQNIFLGLFETVEEASEAYRNARIKYFGEFSPYSSKNEEKEG